MVIKPARALLWSEIPRSEIPRSEIPRSEILRLPGRHGAGWAELGLAAGCCGAGGCVAAD